MTTKLRRINQCGHPNHKLLHNSQDGHYKQTGQATSWSLVKSKLRFLLFLFIDAQVAYRHRRAMLKVICLQSK